MGAHLPEAPQCWHVQVLGEAQTLHEQRQGQRHKSNQLPEDEDTDITPFLTPVGTWELKHMRKLSHLTSLTYKMSKLTPRKVRPHSHIASGMYTPRAVQCKVPHAMPEMQLQPCEPTSFSPHCSPLVYGMQHHLTSPDIGLVLFPA